MTLRDLSLQSERDLPVHNIPFPLRLRQLCKFCIYPLVSLIFSSCHTLAWILFILSSIHSPLLCFPTMLSPLNIILRCTPEWCCRYTDQLLNNHEAFDALCVHSIAFCFTASAPSSSPILLSKFSHFLKKDLKKIISLDSMHCNLFLRQTWLYGLSS